MNSNRSVRWLTGALIAAALAAGSLALCLAAFELLLRTGWMDQAGAKYANWHPSRYADMDKKIWDANWARTRSIPFNFNDKIRTLGKPSSARRIAVIGDSFVWGDGLPYGHSWSQKLERKVANQYPHVEVMSWGLCGWSTQSELAFLMMLDKLRLDFQVDLFLVGFVSNDPDMGDIPQKRLSWQESPRWAALRRCLPNAFDFIASYSNRFVAKYFLKEYRGEAWEEALYRPKNLEKYGELLKAFSAYARAKKIPLVFVLTPTFPDENFRKKQDAVKPLLKNAGIPYLDLLPAMARKFSGVAPSEMVASPVNGHPGDRVTDFYSDEVLAYLERSGWLNK